MKLMIKQRMDDWEVSNGAQDVPQNTIGDVYDVYHEQRERVYSLRKESSLLVNTFYLYDLEDRLLASLRGKVSLNQKHELIIAGRRMGTIYQDSFSFHPRYRLDCNGWQLKWNTATMSYDVVTSRGRIVLHISKKEYGWGYTYVLDIPDPKNDLLCLMIAMFLDDSIKTE